ncbi:YihY family inner membrane protein [Gammaproteobacteria bacterium]|nr:YihY family inner membrane protein [Gammaproteobacteria bacterium]
MGICLLIITDDLVKHSSSYSISLITRVFSRVRHGRLHSVASALAFTTLLALVPLITVSFSILSLFPFFSSWRGSVEDFLYSNLVPATGEVVSGYLREFSSQAGTLTGLGLIALMATALLLLSTIEDALNGIWGVRKGRTLLQRLLLYWAMLTLGPILVVASLSLSSYLGSLVFLDLMPSLQLVSATVLPALPILVEGLGFFLMYLVIPNCPVRFRYALTGAITAMVLFEIAKNMFIFYVANFNTYQIIYGVLWTIPVVLVWIFVSWLVTLLGACVAAEMAVLVSAVVPAPRMRPVMGSTTDATQNRSRKNR